VTVPSRDCDILRGQGYAFARWKGADTAPALLDSTHRRGTKVA
jgi:hypothetical protein